MGGSIGEVLLKNLAWALSILLLLATTSFSAGTPPSGRKLYKWVDEQGVTHFGDHIPPEYASQEQHVINSQGVETEQQRDLLTSTNTMTQAQGFHFSKAVGADCAGELLRQGRIASAGESVFKSRAAK